MKFTNEVTIDTWIYNPAAAEDENAAETLEVSVTASYIPGSPGRFSGPPEHCYPEEPAEVELLSIEGDAGFRLDPTELSDAERARLEQEVVTWMESQDCEPDCD